MPLRPAVLWFLTRTRSPSASVTPSITSAEIVLVKVRLTVPAAVAAFDRVTVVPEVETTVVLAGMPVPVTVAPFAIATDALVTAVTLVEETAVVPLVT